MSARQSQSVYDRLAGWALPAIAALTPFVFFWPMPMPDQQAYFVIMATLLTTAGLGAAWAAGWRAAPSCRPPLPAWLAAGLGLSALVSIGLSGQWALGLRKSLLPMAGLLFLGQLASHPARARVLRRVTVALAGVALLASALGIAQFFGAKIFMPVGEIPKNGVMATFGHPNFLGSVLSPMLFLTAFVGLGWRRRWARAATLACLAPMAACLLATRARAACLGALGGCIFLIAARVAASVCDGLKAPDGSDAPGASGALSGPAASNVAARGHRRAIWRALAGSACLAACMAVAWFVAAPPRWRPGAIAGRLLAANEIKSRLYYWDAAIGLGRQHPAFGLGVGMFDAQFWPWVLAHQESPMGPYYRDFMPAIVRRTAQHPHDEYLEVFAEQGYVGLALFLGLILYFAERGALACAQCRDRAERARRRLVLAALTAALIDAAFGFPWRLPASLLAFVTILGWLREFIHPRGQRAPDGVAD